MKSKIVAIACMLAMLISVFSPVLADATFASTTKVELNKSKITCMKGSEYQLKVLNTKKVVKWSSSNKNIVTVSSKGKIKVKKKLGTAYVSAKVNGKTYKCKVVVKKKSDIDEKVYEIRNWVVSDIWNDAICNFCWYEWQGTDCYGKKLTKAKVKKMVEKYKEAAKKRSSYDKYMDSLINGRYSKVKKAWKKTNKKIIECNDILKERLPIANSIDEEEESEFYMGDEVWDLYLAF